MHNIFWVWLISVALSNSGVAHDRGVFNILLGNNLICALDVFDSFRVLVVYID
jgi:hypothetical protein